MDTRYRGPRASARDSAKSLSLPTLALEPNHDPLCARGKGRRLRPSKGLDHLLRGRRHDRVAERADLDLQPGFLDRIDSNLDVRRKGVPLDERVDGELPP